MSTQSSFEDLANLTDREIQTLLREVDHKDCVVALKGAGEAVNAKFLGNMSERVQTFIKKEMEFLGTLTPEEIAASHRRILQQAAGLGLLQKHA